MKTSEKNVNVQKCKMAKSIYLYLHFSLIYIPVYFQVIDFIQPALNTG